MIKCAFAPFHFHSFTKKFLFAIVQYFIILLLYLFQIIKITFTTSFLDVKKEGANTFFFLYFRDIPRFSCFIFYLYNITKIFFQIKSFFSFNRQFLKTPPIAHGRNLRLCPFPFFHKITSC